MYYYFLKIRQEENHEFHLRSGGGAAGISCRVFHADKLSCARSCRQAKEAQRRVILSAYDDLIENNRRRIQLLEQAARLLYKEWFVHLRFPGHEHVTITDGVPEGWEKPIAQRIIRRSLRPSGSFSGWRAPIAPWRISSARYRCRSRSTAVWRQC